MNHKTIAYLLFVALASSGLTSCDHKELEFRSLVPDKTYTARVIYDWSYAPDANPASMELCLYPDRSEEHLSFNLQGRDGGYITLVEDCYDAISMNNDDLDWALYRYTHDKDNFEVYTHDAGELGAYKQLADHLGNSRADNTERLAATPEQSWSCRTDRITITHKENENVITLCPQEIGCHYSVEIHNVDNIESARGQLLNGTLSGMAEGYSHGSFITTDVCVTMPFILNVDTDTNTLTAEFLTFGECKNKKATHQLGVYLFTADGTKWEKSFDVDSQISEAPDPRHVKIVIDGLEFPKIENTGGLSPEVEEWNSEIIDIGM